MRAWREKQPTRPDGFDRNLSSDRLVDIIPILNAYAPILQRQQQVYRQLSTALLHRNHDAVYAPNLAADRQVLAKAALRERDRQFAAPAVARMVAVGEHLRTARDATPPPGPRFDFMQ